MTADQLQQVLDRLGVVSVGGTSVARCVACQADEDDPENWKLHVSAGKWCPVVVFCCRCGVPQDKQHNRAVARLNFTQAGVDLGLVYQRMSTEEIRSLWRQVTVGGRRPVLTGEEGRADDDTLHSTYSGLLSELILSDRHRRWLKRKGIDPDWAFDRGYRTADSMEVGLHQRPPVGVPGLLSDGRWLLREGSLLIPCRDRSGRVQAVKQRLSGASKKGRLRLLSGGGVKAKSVIHWPVGSAIHSQWSLWATEGERKSDAVHFHFGCPVIGLPGVGAVGRAVPFGVEAGSVVLAFDNDEAGRRAEEQMGRMLATQGVGDIEVARWEGVKGIDDALAKGIPVKLEEWQEPERIDGPPPTKGSGCSLRKGQSLSDAQIIPYLKAFGKTLRHELKAYPYTVARLIADGAIRMHKGPEGQWLEVNDAADAGV